VFSHVEGLRTTASARALYPLELYVMARRVKSQARGVDYARKIKEYGIGAEVASPAASVVGKLDFLSDL